MVMTWLPSFTRQDPEALHVIHCLSVIEHVLVYWSAAAHASDDLDLNVCRHVV